MCSLIIMQLLFLLVLSDVILWSPVSWVPSSPICKEFIPLGFHAHPAGNQQLSHRDMLGSHQDILGSHRDMLGSRQNSRCESHRGFRLESPGISPGIPLGLGGIPTKIPSGIPVGFPAGSCTIPSGIPHHIFCGVHYHRLKITFL